MKIFVTGGTGFIGRPIVDKLIAQGHIVGVLSRTMSKAKNQKIKIINGDLANISLWKNKLKRFKPDAAIHLAWEGLPDHSVRISRKNLEFGLNLTELLAEIGCKRMVAIGSCWEYGLHTGKIDEEAEIKPFDPFTAAKHSFHWLGKEIAKEGNMEFIWARLFYVYGPGQHPKSLVPHLIESAKLKKLPEIRNPDAENDFVFVNDAAEAMVRLVVNPLKRDVYNVGSGKLIHIADIIKQVSNKLNIQTNFKKAEKNYRDTAKSFYSDISKMKKDHKWKPETSISKGVEQTINSRDL